MVGLICCVCAFISLILLLPWVIYKIYKAVVVFFLAYRYHEAAKTRRSEWQRRVCCSWACLVRLGKQFL